MPVRARTNAEEVTIRAVVTRADGRVEDLGVIAYHHRNPIKRLAWRVRHHIRRRARR